MSAACTTNFISKSVTPPKTDTQLGGTNLNENLLSETSPRVDCIPVGGDASAREYSPPKLGGKGSTTCRPVDSLYNS